MLFDAVLHLASGTVELLIQRRGGELLAGQRGDDKPGIPPFGEVLGFADDTAAAAPALSGAVEQVLVEARRLPGLYKTPAGPLEVGTQGPLQTLIAGQSKDIVHRVILAPGHELFAGKSRVAAQDNPHPRPVLTDLPNDAPHFLAHAR